MSLIEELAKETSKCISCTFCESVCPTLPAMDYRSIFGARGRVLLAKEMVKDIEKNGKTGYNISDPFYSCLECYACFNVCPAGVNAGYISELVRALIASKEYVNKNMEKMVARMIVNSIMNFNSPLGLGKEINSWSKSLIFDNDSDTLLYTGGMYQLMAYSKILSELERRFRQENVEKIAKIIVKYPELIRITSITFDEKLKVRMDNILRSIYTLLKFAGVKFKYLENEPYPGSFIYELGYINEFIEYGKRLKELFDSNGIKNIITIDPHTYEILKDIYPKYIEGFNYNVTHYLDHIKNLNFIKGDEKLVFHEPCHFSMHNAKYNEPLNFILKVGVAKLPPRHGSTSFCCGGPAELLYPNISNSISNKRFQELKDTGGDKIITSCPICFVNLSKDDSVFDLAEILEKKLNKK